MKGSETLQYAPSIMSHPKWLPKIDTELQSVLYSFSIGEIRLQDMQNCLITPH